LDLAFHRPELLSGVGFSLSSQAEKVTSSNEANRFVVPGRRNLFTGSGSQPDLDWQIWIAHAPRQMARTASLAENGDPGTLKTERPQRNLCASGPVFRFAGRAGNKE
jgi:hypothetical protein